MVWFCFVFREQECVPAWAGWGEGQMERERIPSRLMPNVEPDAGLDLTTLRSRPEPK